MNLLFLKKIARIIRPQVEVGGLEITDTGILFFSIHPETKKTKQYSIPLEAGIVYEGKVKNSEALTQTLIKLHHIIQGHKKGIIPVVVSISDEHIFTQVFTLPKSIGNAFDEAIRLNMQTLSPIDFLKSYSDWERADANPEQEETEIISSFVERGVVDAIITSLERSGFSIVAIEQRSASLARFVSKHESNLSHDKSYMLLHIGGDGLTIAIVCRGHLHFNKFSSWGTIIKETHATRDIVFDDFASLLIREAHQVSNFFVSRSRTPIVGLYVMAGAMNDHVVAVIKNKLPFNVNTLSVAHQPEDESWFVSVGAALRGLASRTDDISISLAPEGTQDMLAHEQVLSFMAAWRTMFLVFGFIILLAYTGVFVFLNSVAGSISKDLTTSLTSASVNRYHELKKEATSFNEAVARAKAVQSQQIRWSDFLHNIYNQAGSLIRIERVYTQDQNSEITINARTNYEESAIEFKRRIEQLPNVSDVELPLTSITQADQNTITFKLTLKKTTK
jgi:hypothetical protein